MRGRGRFSACVAGEGQSGRVRAAPGTPSPRCAVTPVGTYCRGGCGSTRAPALGRWCSTRAARSRRGCGSSCRPAPCRDTWAGEGQRWLRVAPPPRHLARSGRLRAAWGCGLVLVGVVGVLVWVLQVPALALRPRLGVVHGAAVLLPVAGHADGCQQPGRLSEGTTRGTGCPWVTALTILALLDAAALVPYVGVDGVTPRAPLVPVGVSAVILLQPVAGGWQEPAGSRVGRKAARSPSPRGGHSHNAVPPLVGAIAPMLSLLPPCCPYCPHAVPSPFLVAPCCPGPLAGTAGQPGTRGHLWSWGVVACQCWQRRPFSVVARVPR